MLDLDSRGLETSVFPQYFDYVLFPDGRLVEIVGYEAGSGELLTNTLFVAVGDDPPSVEGQSMRRFRGAKADDSK